MHDLYRENILDHGINPRNRGILDPADADYEANNSLCGDRLRLTVRITGSQRITAVGWDCAGCAISQAAASMLGEAIIGKTVDQVKRIGKHDIFDMLGVPLSTNRVRCALLPLKVLTVALYGPDEWHKHEIEDEED